MNGFSKCVHPHPGILFSHKKQRSPDTHYHVDGPWEHDAQWEKQTRKDTHGVIPLMGNVQSRPIQRHRAWVPGCQGLGSEEWRVTANIVRISLRGDGMFWVKQWWWSHNTLNIWKRQPYTLKEWVLWCVNCVSKNIAAHSPPCTPELSSFPFMTFRFASCLLSSAWRDWAPRGQGYCVPTSRTSPCTQ